MIDWSSFVSTVRAGKRFALTTHIRPDADAIGSQQTLAEILESLGKEVLLVNGFALPPSLAFLDCKHRHRQLGVDVTAEAVESCDALIVVDTTAWAQLGPMADVVRNTRVKKMVLDHHVTSDDLGADLFKDETAEASGRLVIEAADALGVAITEAIAWPAFAALSTDTGWFRFSSTTAGTYALAGRLVAAGVRPDQLYKLLYENDSLGRLRLMGRALERTQTERDGQLIYTWLTQKDFAEAGASPQDSEDIINETLHVGGTQVAVLWVEQKSGGFKISFRSRCEFDCSAVAKKFGGGGHKKAAGASFAGTFDALKTEVLDAVRAAMP